MGSQICLLLTKIHSWIQNWRKVNFLPSFHPTFLIQTKYFPPCFFLNVNDEFAVLMVGHLSGKKSDLAGLYPYWSNVCHHLGWMSRLSGLRNQNTSKRNVCSFTNCMTFLFLDRHSMRQEECWGGWHNGSCHEVCSWSHDAGYADVSLTVSSHSVLGYSLFSTLEPPTTDWCQWLWDWIGNTWLPNGTCMSARHLTLTSLSKAPHTFTTVL